VEVEAFPVAVLAHQMAQGALAQAPIWSDLRTFDSRAWRGCVDILTAGFPCQPFSCAGKGLGDKDPRHLWPHVRRAINGARPRLVFLENVPGLLTVRQSDGRPAYAVVREQLERLAYRVEAVLVTAAEVGASHKRERLFILGAMGHAEQPRLEVHRRDERGRREPGRDDSQPTRPAWPPGPTDTEQWAAVLARWPDLAPATQRAVRKLDDGVCTQVDELRAYGNAVCPEQGAYALRLLLDASSKSGSESVFTRSLYDPKEKQ